MTTTHAAHVPEAAAVGAPTLVIERRFNFPRAIVFEAWTDPALLAEWFAPRDSTLQIERLDVRPGGGFHLCVHSPSFDCWTIGTYTEIVHPERIVFTMAIADTSGAAATSDSQGHDPAWPSETVVRVTFTERDGQTMMRLEQNVSEALAKQTGAQAGWLEMLDRLTERLTL